MTNKSTRSHSLHSFTKSTHAPTKVSIVHKLKANPKDPNTKNSSTPPTIRAPTRDGTRRVASFASSDSSIDRQGQPRPKSRTASLSLLPLPERFAIVAFLFTHTCYKFSRFSVSPFASMQTVSLVKLVTVQVISRCEDDFQCWLVRVVWAMFRLT